MVKRKSKKYPFQKSDSPKLLTWASKQEYFSILNGNNYSTLYGPFPDLIFVGRTDFIECSKDSFERLNNLIRDKKDWIYGYFSYDLKNEIEDLKSNNPASIPVNHVGFYVPETVILVQKNQLVIQSVKEPDMVFKEILAGNEMTNKLKFTIGPISSSTPKWQYLEHINKIKSAIVEGEYYEMNYCIEFTANVQSFDPATCYQLLSTISPMPFSGLLRIDDTYLICASPERFLKKEGDKIISQPIKGTIRRSFDKDEDETLKRALKSSEKERAENLMIVDLVRNDLAKSAQTGSVKVDELFGIYTFSKVHQMISTITASHDSSIRNAEIIKNAFPMGSMTGAPKVRVMEEIESLEHSARGLYSGSIGYFKPNDDFDFNVVIRSIVYNSTSKKLSFHVGSAITFDSDPEYEYKECLLKAESLMEVLSS